MTERQPVYMQVHREQIFDSSWRTNPPWLSHGAQQSSHSHIAPHSPFRAIGMETLQDFGIMIYSHHCYTPRWRCQMRARYLQFAVHMGESDLRQIGMMAVCTAKDLLAADLDNEALSEAFAALSLEEQSRYLDMLEIA